MNETDKKIFSEPAEAARKVVEIFGTDILADHRRFCSAFSDIAPRLSKENKAFFVALSENVGVLYLNAYSEVSSGHASPDDINKRAYAVVSEFLNKEKARMVVASLSFALGWEPDETANDSPAESESVSLSGSVTEDLFRRAENGDEDAQFNLAERFYFGRGVKQSYSRAVQWYTKAADAGDCSSQKRLGDCFHAGQGVETNYRKAAQYYFKAAEQGDYDSQKALIRCYQTGGPGLLKDSEKAQLLSERYGIELSSPIGTDSFAEDAEDGTPEAQFRLAVRFFLGDGVICDKHEAVRLYEKAAAQNHALAQFNLAKCLSDGNGIEQNPKAAVMWYEKSASNGNADALNNLAGCFFHGNGTEKNLTKAAELYRKAAESGSARAQYNYGECCYNGFGAEQNYYEAVLWYNKAAMQNLHEAQYSLGWCYYMGEGVKRDYNAAKRLFELAAAQRNPNAQIMLAYCCLNGQGTEKNYAKAAEWFGKAALRGSKEAAEMLVKCLATGGFYLVRDMEKARRTAEKYGVELQTL